jgi:hypothetical protein
MSAYKKQLIDPKVFVLINEIKNNIDAISNNISATMNQHNNMSEQLVQQHDVKIDELNAAAKESELTLNRLIDNIKTSKNKEYTQLIEASRIHLKNSMTMTDCLDAEYAQLVKNSNAQTGGVNAKLDELDNMHKKLINPPKGGRKKSRKFRKK